jgi:hypothetical protein
MNLAEDFHKHATDCERMAKWTRDAASKAAWLQLAEKFRRYGENISAQSLATAHHKPRLNAGEKALGH